MSRTPGVEIRNASIRILFSYQGKQRRETLFLDNEPLAPTPANIKYAVRIAAEVRDKVRLGFFRYAEYFPRSPLAQAQEATRAVPLLFDVMDEWLRVHDMKSSTRSQYTTRVNSFWKIHLRNIPIDQVRYSDVLKGLAAGTWKSAKSRNNELSMIRGPFEYAVRDGYIAKNPCDDINAKKVQSPTPDPFTLDEASLILAHLQAHRAQPIANFVQLMMFAGLRTSEGIGLQWRNIDFRLKEMHIEGGNVYDEESETTKTAKARTVLLNDAAHDALLRQKAFTFLAEGHVFHDPKTDKPWKYKTITDARSFWEITLKQLGIRYRRQYNMRHTYATIGLMSGARPAFLANQLGHSTRMFFDVYSKWINSGDDRVEIAKVDAAIKRRTSTSPTAPED